MDTYEKRVGTSGISGQLYETKLVSLILFRLLHDDSVEEFYLASNMDEIGAFDDICFRAKIKGLKRPILVFLQAKHKEDGDSFLYYDLIKNFHESYIKVKDIFYASKTASQDVFFKGKFEDVDCVFVLYTNAKFYEDTNVTLFDLPVTSSTAPPKQIRKPYESEFAAKLSSLIGTGKENAQGSQADYTEKDLDAANDKISEEEIATLADRFAKFLNDQSMNIMLDKYIVLYHVILAQKVVSISEVKFEEIKSVKKEKVSKAGQKNEPNPKIQSKQNKHEKVDVELHKATIIDSTKHLSQEKISGGNSQNIEKISVPNLETTKTKGISTNNRNQNKPQQKPGIISEKNNPKPITGHVTHEKDSESSKNANKSKQDLNRQGVQSDLKNELKTEKRTSLHNNKTMQGTICRNEIETDATKSEQKDKEKKPEQKPEIRKYRELTFRPDFFSTDDISLIILRNKIYETVINNHIKNKKKQKPTPKTDASTSFGIVSDELEINKHIKAFLTDPSPLTLSPLIGTCIVFKENKLQFIVKIPNDYLEALEKINTVQPDLSMLVQEAETITAKNILSSLILKVPATFGNADLTIAGDSDKIEKRLKILADFIEKICQKSTSQGLYNVVTIDKSVGGGFLSLTGGIGSAVGNLLVYDKATKLLKFANNCELLKDNARALFCKLKSNSNISSNFDSYRFDTRSLIDFPKLEFDYTDEAKNILSKLVVYEKQGSHHIVEQILSKEIEQYQSLQVNEMQQMKVQTDKLSTYYHNEIQNWWKTPKSAKFFTKSSNVFKKSVNNILLEPQISALQIAFYMNHINNTKYDLNEESIELLAEIESHNKAIIITDISTLTTLKLIQYLRNKEFNQYAILDLEFVLNFPTKDFTTLESEIKNTDKLLIFVCDKPKNLRLVHRTLNALAETTVKAKMIVITNTEFVEMAQQYFGPADIVLNDERQSLKVLTPESMRHVIENTVVIFQDNKINLNVLVNDESAAYVKGTVLNKIIRNETITIGKSVNDANYERTEYVYVERKVHQSPYDEKNHLYDYIADYSVQIDTKPKGHYVRRFEDIEDDVVLITGAPGMGKSTLLTRLSLKAKEYDKELWIVRINLLDHSKAFFDWQTHKTVIDIPETLKVICQVITKDNNIDIRVKETNHKVHLEESTGDEWTDFELNMFLHFYNERKLLLLFDGFDEICPHYKENVIDFLNVVMTYPRKHKLWVTSRPYSEILPDLQRVLGKSYELEYINDTIQEIYVYRYWKKNLIIKNLNDVQLRKVISYLDFMRTQNDPQIARIFHLFYAYVSRHFPDIRELPTYDHLVPIMLNPNLTDLKGGLVSRRVDIVMGTPLLLYLHCNYFVNLISDDTDTVDWKSHLKYSMLSIYGKLVESKLKILFKVKNQMDVYAPDVMRKYKKDYIECIDRHKKIAAYTLFFHRIHLEEIKHLHPFKEENEYEDVIDEIKCGTEKIGLISHVTADNIAVFVYKSLEEYFASEFLCDIFNNDNIDIKSKNIMYSIANVTYGIFPWITRKRIVDVELGKNLNALYRIRHPYVNSYAYYFSTGWSIENLIRIRSTSVDDFEPGCFDEYNEQFYKDLRRLEPEQLNLKIIEFQKNVIAKMKPHLKQYFTPFPGETELT